MILVLVACGNDEQPGDAGTSTDPQRLDVACLGVAFAERALASPRGAEEAQDPPAAALRRFLARSGPDIPDADSGWQLLRRTPELALFGYGARRGRLEQGVKVERRAGEWRVTGWGTCEPRRQSREFEIAPWRLSGSAELTATTRRVPVVIETGGCVGVDGPEQAARRFDHVEVRTSRRFVTVTVLLRKRPAARDRTGEEVCAGVGLLFERTITLPEPLRDRVLRDGSSVPPKPVPSPHDRQRRGRPDGSG